MDPRLPGHVTARHPADATRPDVGEEPLVERPPEPAPPMVRARADHVDVGLVRPVRADEPDEEADQPIPLVLGDPGRAREVLEPQPRQEGVHLRPPHHSSIWPTSRAWSASTGRRRRNSPGSVIGRPATRRRSPRANWSGTSEAEDLAEVVDERQHAALGPGVLPDAELPEGDRGDRQDDGDPDPPPRTPGARRRRPARARRRTGRSRRRRRRGRSSPTARHRGRRWRPHRRSRSPRRRRRRARPRRIDPAGVVGCGGRPGVLGRAIAIGRRVGEAPLAGRRRRRARRRSGSAVGALGGGVCGGSVSGRSRRHRSRSARRRRRPRPPRLRGGRRLATLDSSHRESPEPRPAAARPDRRPARAAAADPRRRASGSAARALRVAMDRRPDDRATRYDEAGLRQPPARRRAPRRAGRPVVATGDPRLGPRIRRVDRAALPPPARPDGRPRSACAKGSAPRCRACSPPASCRAPAPPSTRRSRSTAGIAASPATHASATPSCSCSTRAADR